MNSMLLPLSRPLQLGSFSAGLRKLSWAAGVLALALGGPQAQAAVVYASDNFTLSSGTNVGTVSNAEAAGVGTYSTIQPGGGTGLSVTTVSGFGSGNVLSLANNTNTYYRGFDGGATFSLSSLQAGETLSLSYNVAFTGTFTGADNFSFGFVNATTANSIVYANVDLNSAGGIDSEFRYREGSFNMSDAGVVLGTGFNNSSTGNLNATGGYTFQFDVTKQSGGDYRIDLYLDGTLKGSTVQTTWGTNQQAASMTGIAFRHSQTPGVTTYLDNVSVSVVPEPGPAMLLALGAVAFAFTRVRGRRHL